MSVNENLNKFEEFFKNYPIPNPNIDCSEIAEDLYEEAIKLGLTCSIISILPSAENRIGLVKVIEAECWTEFEYHDIMLCNEHVYDPRYFKDCRKPIKESEFWDKFNSLNEEGTFLWEKVRQFKTNK